jgi:dihydroneopterin aldolase/2-amino-4-hydroxy-6-hydroxymethyldihydropteridine diphosphokinase
MDRIEISGLRVMTVIGVLPHEREAPQPLQVDLSLHVDLHDAGYSDELGDTANYGAVAEAVADLARESKDLLLERLAHKIAETVLTFDRVEAVDVLLTKLRPPIPEDVGATAVRLHRTRQQMNVPPRQVHRAVVALGSNLGDRVGFLRFAVDQLQPVALSQVFETDPVGGPDAQGAYLNMVAVVETGLDPYALIRRLQRIEAEAGRQRVIHWGPRTLDLDLLFYDDATLVSDELIVPHPRYAERRFVLAPLAEVAPERCPEGWDDVLPAEGVHPLGPLEAL